MHSKDKSQHVSVKSTTCSPILAIGWNLSLIQGHVICRLGLVIQVGHIPLAFLHMQVCTYAPVLKASRKGRPPTKLISVNGMQQHESNRQAGQTWQVWRKAKILLWWLVIG